MLLVHHCRHSSLTHLDWLFFERAHRVALCSHTYMLLVEVALRHYDLTGLVNDLFHVWLDSLAAVRLFRQVASSTIGLSTVWFKHF